MAGSELDGGGTLRPDSHQDEPLHRASSGNRGNVEAGVFSCQSELSPGVGHAAVENALIGQTMPSRVKLDDPVSLGKRSVKGNDRRNRPLQLNVADIPATR
jgi:hypothetical protein